jgi:hydroxymethylglutaryl-CoA lyase
MSSRAAAIRIVEVGPRDGLQNVSGFIPTTIKIELITRLREAGLQTIELTSVVSAKAIPQLADCQSVLSDPTVATLQKQQCLRLPVLIPNLKGLEIAIKYDIKEIAVFVSATEGFSQANINCSVEEGLQRATKVATAAKLAGLAVRGCVKYSHFPTQDRTDLL